MGVEGDGGAVSAKVKEAKGHYVMLRDQIVDLINLPTPTVGHIRNHDEDLDDYLQRREDYIEGRAKGMPGASLGVAIRLEQEGIELFGTLTTALSGRSPEFRKNSNANPAEFVEDLIAANLLPTPNTMDSLPARTGEALERQLRRGVEGGSVRSTTGNLREDIVLLSTPLVDDAKNTGHNTKRYSTLASDVYVLPTPLASEGTKQDTTITAEERIANGNQVALTNIARSGVDNPQIWGKYEPAIKRWEFVLGRPAPAPTKPDGKDGAHRLSSVFTEWMMGLPEGWITDCGLTRNEELKLAGNGVVPQQAEIALRILLPKQLIKESE
jgi:hypothetical protein